MKRKTHEDFIIELNNINPKIIILDKYINAHTKMECECVDCGNHWFAKPNMLLSQKTGCPICRQKQVHDKKLFTQEEFELGVKKLNPHIKVLNKYIQMKENIEWQCLICNNIHITKASNIFYKKRVGCENCGFIKMALLKRKSHNKFVEEMNKINSNIIILDEYQGLKNKIKITCKTCSYTWESYPGDLLGGSLCPSCNESKGETKIKNYLINNKILFIKNMRFEDCKNKKKLPFDFYLLNKNILIEYDGIQHYQPIDKFGGKKEFENRQRNDSIKNKYCINNNIILIRIPYWEFNNVTKILNEALFLNDTI